MKTNSYNLTYKQWQEGRKHLALYGYLKKNQRKKIIHHSVVWSFITISLGLGWHWCWTMAQADDIGWLLLTRPLIAGFLLAFIFGVGGFCEKISDYHKLNDELQKNLKRIVFG